MTTYKLSIKIPTDKKPKRTIRQIRANSYGEAVAMLSVIEPGATVVSGRIKRSFHDFI